MNIKVLNTENSNDIINKINEKTTRQWEEEFGGSEISDRIMKTLSKM